MSHPMPNDREQFEAAYRKIYPATYPTITPNAFERDHDGYYIRTPIQEAWAWWQAGAAAERERINAFHSITRRAIVRAAASIGARTKGETA